MWTLIILSACANQDASNEASAPAAIQSNSVVADASPGLESSSAEAASDALDLDDWETELVGGILAEVRAGVQLFDEEGFGLCTQGEKNKCGVYIGNNPGVLPHGRYFIRASLQAPEASEGWKVEMEHSCSVYGRNGEISETKPKVRSYPVKYKKNIRYPVRMPAVISPTTNGRNECRFKLSSMRPDGQKVLISEGTYTLPDQQGEAPNYDAFIESFQAAETSIESTQEIE